MISVKNKILSVLCFSCLLVGMMFSFAGCENANAVYSKFITEMDSIISENNDVFSNRSVSVSYSEDIEKLILADSNYNKLGHGTAVEQGVTYNALFEPVLASGLEVVLVYYDKINMSKLAVSSNSANQLVNDLQNFKSALQKFVDVKRTLDQRTNITIINSVIKKELDELCVNYKNLINSALVFGKDFANIYKNEIFEKSTFSNGRYPLGEMKLNYLTELNTFAEFDTRTAVQNYYNKKYEAKSITNSEALFVEYQNIKEYNNWEELTATISNQEKECINTYTSILNYKPIFYDKLSIANYALSCINLEDYYKFNSGEYKQTDFDNNTRTSVIQINQFVNTYAQNYANYLALLAQNVKTLKTTI